MIEDLEGISLFQDLSLSQLNDISQYCELKMLNDGDMLIRENEHDDLDLYVLCKGSVEIVSSSNPITSGEVVISKEDKDVFGEMAWLTKRNRTASVRCYGQVTAIRVDGHALLDYLDENPSAGYAVMRRLALILSQRLETTDGLLKQILWNTLL